jgi:hypothetical protein
LAGVPSHRYGTACESAVTVASCRCGIIGADARPNWKGQPQRESLTGAHSGESPCPCAGLKEKSWRLSAARAGESLTSGPQWRMARIPIGMRPVSNYPAQLRRRRFPCVLVHGRLCETGRIEDAAQGVQRAGRWRRGVCSSFTKGPAVAADPVARRRGGGRGRLIRATAGRRPFVSAPWSMAAGGSAGAESGGVVPG